MLVDDVWYRVILSVKTSTSPDGTVQSSVAGKIWADGQYTGWLIDWVAEELDVCLEIVQRNDDMSGFVVLPRRWVVERTFAWLGRYKRLAKDYELCPEHSESMVYVAMSHILLRRLAN